MQVCILRSDKEVEIVQAKDILEQNNIDSYIKNQHSKSMFSNAFTFGVFDNKSGQMQLFVRSEDETFARELLDGLFL